MTMNEIDADLEDLRERFDTMHAKVVEKISAACVVFELTDVVESDDIFALSNAIAVIQGDTAEEQDDDDTSDGRQRVLVLANGLFAMMANGIVEMFELFDDVIETERTTESTYAY